MDARAGPHINNVGFCERLTSVQAPGHVYLLVRQLFSNQQRKESDTFRNLNFLRRLFVANPVENDLSCEKWVKWYLKIIQGGICGEVTLSNAEEIQVRSDLDWAF